MTAVANRNEIESMTSQLHTTRRAGDYDRFSQYMEDEACAFYERSGIQLGSHLLDVACGSGKLALLAARDGVDVIATDIAEHLIARANEHAAAQQLTACFQIADAEKLP